MYSLITNSKKGTLLDELVQSLESCQTFYFNVAFVNFSGLQLLLDPLLTAEKNGAKGKILTGTYLNFTEPYALSRLKQFSQIDTRVFVATKAIGFHPKAYIFEYEDYYKVIVGSSNLTQSALKSNIEWNLQIIAKTEAEDKLFFEEVMDAYDLLWKASEPLDEEFLAEYKSFIENRKQESLVRETPMFFQFTRDPSIKPNAMQLEATKRLEQLRLKQQDKALVVAATGTGKTYLSAFDVKQSKPNRLLFLVHREDILNKAKDSFSKVINLKHKRTGILSGTSKESDADYLFATIQTMKSVYEQYANDYFDYVIVDEAHHATSPSYEKVLNHFKPQFLLGMTATPERTDDGNIFDLFDNNVPVEVRLRDALDYDLLVPFHYFGITDESGVDLSGAGKLTPDQIAKKLSVHRRVDFVIDKMQFYGNDGTKRKALGFCMTKEHARYMAAEFTKQGIKSIALTGEDSVAKRDEQIKLLEEDYTDLEVIFTVDIFNEGIDIPGVNLIMMLRPTQSPIVFTQQLGRGLRKKEDKQFLTVLDFIGNYSKSFLIAIALTGKKVYDKESVKTAVKQDFSDLPGATHIQLDKISKEQILEQIDAENFSNLKYLKQNYSEFKNLNRGKIPWKLQDYLTIEGAPDPTKFFKKSGTVKSRNYLKFLEIVEENNEQVLEWTSDALFMKMLTQLSQLLPLVRLHEFIILEYLLTNETISLSEAKMLLLTYLNTVDEDSIWHAFETLSMKYADKKELQQEIPFVDAVGSSALKRSKNYSVILENQTYVEILKDVLHYGRIRYLKEFGATNYGVPHLKMYEGYTMREVALAVNHQKTHSSFRGSTLKDDELNHYFLFVDLHKGEKIKESIKYNDQFISSTQFQWESPNSTKLDSERGQDLTHSAERGLTIHLFVRKFKQVDGVTMKYIYLGEVTPTSYQNEQPIEIQYQLENEVPWDLYNEFEPELLIQ